RAEAHASDFVEARRRQVEWLAEAMDRPPIIVCPYDAELFGHWWFEGPLWLELVLRRLATAGDIVAATPGDDLDRHPTVQLATPSGSTWGWKDRKTTPLNSTHSPISYALFCLQKH